MTHAAALQDRVSIVSCTHERSFIIFCVAIFDQTYDLIDGIHLSLDKNIGCFEQAFNER